MSTNGANGQLLLEVNGLRKYFPIRKGFLRKVVGRFLISAERAGKRAQKWNEVQKIGLETGVIFRFLSRAGGSHFRPPHRAHRLGIPHAQDCPFSPLDS